MYVKAKVTKINGQDLDDDAAVGPVNLFLHSLFSQVDISLNGTLVTSSTNTQCSNYMQARVCRAPSLLVRAPILSEIFGVQRGPA